jgi:hypothetical protein
MPSTFQHGLSLVTAVPQITFEERDRWKFLKQISLMSYIYSLNNIPWLYEFLNNI